MHRVSSCLTAGLAAWPSSPAAARAVLSWSGDPRLGCFATAGQAALAARADAELFALLASRPEEEARLAALAVVAGHLVPVVGRWGASGVPATVLDDLDAELVAEVLATLADAPGLGAPRLADRAWQKVSGRRRTERARSARHVALAEWAAPAVPPRAARVSVGGSAAVVVLAALSGWPPKEAAARLGLSPTAWRARTSRARRFVRAELGVG